MPRGASPPPPPQEIAALRRYDIEVSVLPGCELLGEPPSALERLVAGNDGASASTLAAEPLPGDSGSSSELLCLSLSRDGEDCSSWRRGDEGWGGIRLRVWDRLVLSCVAEAVPRLRHVRALRAVPEDSSDALGTTTCTRDGGEAA